MRRVKTAIVGSGFMGRVHLEAIRRTGAADVVAIASRNRAAAEKLAGEFGVPRVGSEYGNILADPAIESVHICTPNAQHFQMAKDALGAGKHVLCEKPLGISTDEGRELSRLARERGVRNCVCHNLRYYPMVQQMRAMREAGELGEILIVEGNYAQDWLLYDTDWNWRVTTEAGGASRCLADIGSHWCDMAEHVAGLRITAICTDLQIFHRTRKQPRTTGETFSKIAGAAQDFRATEVQTEDFGATIFQMGEPTRGSFTASQVSAGRKNRLYLEIHGIRASAAWSQERPDELWIGKRDMPNGVMVKDPALMEPGARAYADLPGGHSEGYGSTFKQLFRRFYASIVDEKADEKSDKKAAGKAASEYPSFDDGLRQLAILEAELKSHAQRGWVGVPAV